MCELKWICLTYAAMHDTCLLNTKPYSFNFTRLWYWQYRICFLKKNISIFNDEVNWKFAVQLGRRVLSRLLQGYHGQPRVSKAGSEYRQGCQGKNGPVWKWIYLLNNPILFYKSLSFLFSLINDSVFKIYVCLSFHVVKNKQFAALFPCNGDIK